MGVRGLKSLIEQHPSLFTRYRLHDERLVIDGYALLFGLYFDQPPCDDGHHGGRYQKFAAKCHLFFQNLAKCNISPYLVFDGAYEKDNKKLAEIKSRSVDRIQTAIAISSGSSGIAVSPCVALVFLQVLDDVGIPYAFCEFEADAETVALANAWNCSAASKDSDFYILDLKAGYLPLDHLDWKNPRKVKASGAEAEPLGRRQRKEASMLPGQFYIECMKYSRNAFCKMFHVKQALLPVFATSVGNDYKDIFGALLDPFHSFVSSQFAQSKSGNRSYNRIMNYLSWLSGKETVEEAIGDMIKHMRGADRMKLRKLIDVSLEMYQVSNSLTIAQFSGSQLSPFNSKLTMSTSIPPWFVTLLNRGKVPALCTNVLCNKRVFLAIQVEDSSQASAGAASLHIRSVLYGILLQKQWSKSTRPPLVEEYAQWAGRFKHTIVEPVYEIDRGDGRKMALPGLEDIPAMHEDERRRVFLATMGVEGSAIRGMPALFQLAFCVTVYLLHHAEPTVHSDQVVALIFSWLHGVAASRQRLISRGQVTPEHLRVGLDNPDVHAILTNCKKYENSYKECRKLDLQVVQSVAQWQQCLLDSVTLSKVLLNPVPLPNMAVLYDGPLIHSVCSILKSMSPAEQRRWVMAELLRGTRPNVRALFDQLFQPTWPLLTPRRKPQKSKKGKRAPSGGSARPSSSTPSRREDEEDSDSDELLAYSVRVFSRFGPLNLDD